MEKLFFCAVLGMMGMVNAKEITLPKKVNVEAEETEKVFLAEQAAMKLPAQWVECSSRLLASGI